MNIKDVTVNIRSIVFMAAFGSGAFSAPAWADYGVNDLLLTAEEVAPACQVIKGNHPARKEAQAFYDSGINSEMLPLVLNKRSQSFQCGRQKGSLFYFEYIDPSQREKAEVHTRTALWGLDTQRSAKRPEHIFHSSRFLMVLSFKDFQKELLTALLKRIKRLDDPSTSKTPENPL